MQCWSCILTIPSPSSFLLSCPFVEERVLSLPNFKSKVMSLSRLEFLTMSSSFRKPSSNHFYLALGRLSLGSFSKNFCSFIGNPNSSFSGVPDLPEKSLSTSIRVFPFGFLKLLSIVLLRDFLLFENILRGFC